MAPVLFETLENGVLGLLEAGLSPALTYHNKAHTVDVLQQAEIIARSEGITGERELLLIKTAALFHDTGFISNYADHEAAGCDFARKILVEAKFDHEIINEVCRMIMTTRVPQSPYNLLSQILCDADLDYLGRDDFFVVGETLKKEWFNYGIIHSMEEWEERQVLFLEAHLYFTGYSIKTRNPEKLKHLQILKQSAKQANKNGK